MGRYFQEDMETASREKITAIQTLGLRKTVKRVYDNVPFYREKMDALGLTPDDIQELEDLKKLPFLTKADLRDSYPYGLLAVPLKDCVEIHSTSGTTGKRVIAYYTRKDKDIWDECCARAIVATGGDENDVVQVAYGYGLFTGGAGLDGGSKLLGSLTLPMSSGNTDRQIQFAIDLKSTVICCTPSYAAAIGEIVTERGLKDQLSLRAGIFGAEAWTEEMRRDIEKSLGIKAYDIYGLTETMGPGVSFECEEQTGMHINEDHFIVEVIDPDTGEYVEDGQPGELVFTSVDKEGFP
ncbi:MAG: phenylacetate--CoA ligase family protein, partial [Lachnospiraceae bacterium]